MHVHPPESVHRMSRARARQLGKTTFSADVPVRPKARQWPKSLSQHTLWALLFLISYPTTSPQLYQIGVRRLTRSRTIRATLKCLDRENVTAAYPFIQLISEHDRHHRSLCQARLAVRERS